MIKSADMPGEGAAPAHCSTIAKRASRSRPGRDLAHEVLELASGRAGQLAFEVGEGDLEGVGELVPRPASYIRLLPGDEGPRYRQAQLDPPGCALVGWLMPTGTDRRLVASVSLLVQADGCGMLAVAGGVAARQAGPHQGGDGRGWPRRTSAG